MNIDTEKIKEVAKSALKAAAQKTLPGQYAFLRGHATEYKVWYGLTEKAVMGWHFTEYDEANEFYLDCCKKYNYARLELVLNDQIFHKGDT